MKKYILYGGNVLDDDGQYHYVSPQELVRLYKLKKEECVLVYNTESNVELRNLSKEFIDSLTALHPKPNGLYSLEEMKV